MELSPFLEDIKKYVTLDESVKQFKLGLEKMV